MSNKQGFPPKVWLSKECWWSCENKIATTPYVPEALLSELEEKLDRLGNVVEKSKLLREAQRRYIADRGNDELGKAVGAAAIELDIALAGEDE